MLELRPNCEHCNKDLSPKSLEAMICTYECTFCRDCAEDIFENVCPNCGGNFSPRPIRPDVQLAKHPASETRLHAPKDLEAFEVLRQKYAHKRPEER